jgi:hypothetical protein
MAWRPFANLSLRMSMNLSDFENELRNLRPSPAPGRLEDAVSAQLVRVPTSVPPAGKIQRGDESRFDRILSGLCWATAGAAAAVIVTVYLGEERSTSVATNTNQDSAAIPSDLTYFEPAESDRQLVSAEAGAVFYGEDEEPAREFRYNSLERHVWANPSTGARVEVQVPRQDIVLVPVSFQ